MDKQLLIKVTPEEEAIFAMLRKYRDQHQLGTVIRVAGGWVRDKILGKESKDIDIALDNMTGQQFITSMKKYSQSGTAKISGIGVIKSNPEQSKNLTTATAKINNYWIDFVNLRSEEYTEDSRIPAIKIGTPLQDAERRDFTINSLFYNVDTGEIEDWTKKGLLDMEKQLLRTPLDPYVTFKDDPLRMMRCLRFKSRLGFQVDEAIYEAMKRPDIKEALLRKVSKERIGIELCGLLKAKLYLQGLEDIKNYDLWNIVFQVPEESDLFPDKDTIAKIPNFSFECLVLFTESLKLNGWATEQSLTCQGEQTEEKPKGKKNQKIQYEKGELQMLLLLSSLTYIYKPYTVKIGKTKTNLLNYMVLHQLKYSAKCSKFAHHFAEAVDKLAQIKSLDNTFTIIRWLRQAEEKWEVAIHFLQAYLRARHEQPHINLFQLREMVLKRGLAGCYLAEAPIDGTFVTKRGIKGPAISKILQNALIWRVINPERPAEDFIKEFEQNADFFMSDDTYR